ncbi:MAG: alpha/beta hydrolase [Alistipes sp.]|nr:alpha/beta hydrolase [Alistipes sp.]
MVTDKFIKAGGFATRIRQYGFDTADEGQADERPVIILLHGYLESLNVWDDFAPMLRDYRVVTMDIPGHGISEVHGDIHTMAMMAQVVTGVADNLGIGKFWIMGHSMGGYVASELLSAAPEKLAGIIMFHSTPNADTEEKKQNRLREIDLVEAGKKDLLAKTVDKGFAAVNRRKFGDFIEDLRELVVLTDEQGIINLLRGMMERADHNDTFRQSTVPQLFIMGELDEYIPLETAKSLEESHPQARFEYLAASGHMGFVEEPVISAGIILDFISRV